MHTDATAENEIHREYDQSQSHDDTPHQNPNASASILSVTDLHKSYGRKEVVCGVSFSIQQGKAIGFLGPNGAGKTTIFHMLVGFIKANKGTITLNNTILNGMPMYKRAQLGITYLPQEASIFRKLTVAQISWPSCKIAEILIECKRKTS